MVAPVVTYRETCARMMAQARVELDAGDLRQASEKAWGAAAQMVKAIAHQRGWRHDSHGGLFRAVRNLSNEARDPEIHRLFMSANGLHVNFYEGGFDAAMVMDHMSRTEQFIARLEPLLAY